MKSKKLYHIVLYATNDEGQVERIEEPRWLTETSKDRVKARALADKLDDDFDWEIDILLEKDYRLGFH